MFSFEKPSSKKTGSVNRIMIGGPQITVTAFSELGAISLAALAAIPPFAFSASAPAGDPPNAGRCAPFGCRPDLPGEIAYSLDSYAKFRIH
jgi:hypothetical protein